MSFSGTCESCVSLLFFFLSDNRKLHPNFSSLITVGKGLKDHLKLIHEVESIEERLPLRA